jgi:hypothetical protein
MMKKIFSFDFETDGLWGAIFAAAAIVYDESGREVARFFGRVPDTKVSNTWVKENVLPQLVGIPVAYEDEESLLADFAKFYLANKADADVIVHMGYIVEAYGLRRMHDLNLIGDWDAPYPLYDVSGNLQMVGEDPTSVDSYVKKFGLQLPEFDGGTHNPLYDSAVAATVYRHILCR